MTENRCLELIDQYTNRTCYKKAWSFAPLKKEGYKFGIQSKVCGVFHRALYFDETTILFIQEEDFFSYFLRQLIHLLRQDQSDSDIEKNLKINPTR